MLIKRTSKNQFTFPKRLLEDAGIGPSDNTFDIRYDRRHHTIVLKPVRVIIEDKIPTEALQRFEEDALKIQPGDKSFKSRKEADSFLKSRMKR